MNASPAVEFTDFTPELIEKLKIVQRELGVDDLNAALDKSLNIAHYVAGVLSDPQSKLLVERRGKYVRLMEFT